MGGCLNSLEEATVFIPTAALIALVLLVWAQLYASGQDSKQPKDFNWVAGLVWTYGAMSFALVAVALFVISEGVAGYAKGFLILSFFMTIANIIIAVFLNITKVCLKKSPGESLTRVPISSGIWGEGWLLFWLLLLIGLGFVSFSLIDKLCDPFLWVGIGLVGAALLLALIGIFCGFKWCLWWSQIRWFLWQKWVWKIRKGEND